MISLAEYKKHLSLHRFPLADDTWNQSSTRQACLYPKNTSQQTRGEIPSCPSIIYQPIIRADQQQSEGTHASCMSFYDQVTHLVAERKAVDAVYLDLNKAFDTVSYYFHIPTQSQFVKALPTPQLPKLIPRHQYFL